MLGASAAEQNIKSINTRLSALMLYEYPSGPCLLRALTYPAYCYF